MRTIEYFDGKRIRKLELRGLFEARQHRPKTFEVGPAGRPAVAAMRPEASGVRLAATLSDQRERLADRFVHLSEGVAEVAAAAPGEATVIPTDSVAIDDASKADLKFLRDRFGLEVVREGSHGKVLMRAPEDTDDGVAHAAQAALALHKRSSSHGDAAPNFVRVVQRPRMAQTAIPGQWGLANPGNPGLVGADVHAEAAWTITKGSEDIRVAILDEGVDSQHPNLKAAIVAELDAVDSNPTAMPDGDDAHGTACAGIVGSRSTTARGLAPRVSLVGARIAKSNAQGFWIFDDFDTADAIDWCWDDAQADVLSNSWGGGPPVPLISSAFERARTQGRNGLGAVLVIAAGNDARSSVSYPGNLPNTLTVGASNQWDKRKTTTSQDGETWWGSNWGQGLDLMAPGVAIRTTDIHGARGYSTTNTTDRFNGTSSATPFVAAAAALVLSASPQLTESQVRSVLRSTADPVSATSGWDRFTGHGRLNAYMAVWASRRL